VAASGTVTMNAGHALAVTATPSGASYSVSGKVTYNGVGQASIRITCGAKTATTDGLGNYIVTGLVNGSYTVTPYYGSMSFYPIRTYITIAGANVTGVNFQMGRTVSGTVTLNGAGLPFVTVSTNTGVTATTLSNGSFSLTGLGPGTYTVTPNRAGYTFTPASRSVTVATVNITGINFTATQTAAPVMGGGDDPGDTSGDTQPGGPMRPDEAEVYYGQDEEEGAMPSPGAIEEPAGEGTGAAAHGAAYAEASEPVPTALQNLKVTFYAWDHLGTIRLVSNSEPFGVELRPIQNQTDNTHQYTGHERDQASGMDYMHYRFYGSNLGRFMKPDNGVDQHVENPQSWNLYAYVRGNPVNFNDPNGRWRGGVHHDFFKLAFPGLSKAQLKVLNKASDHVDRLKNQGTGGSHDHYLAKPGETTAEAKAAIGKHIEDLSKKASQEQGGTPAHASDIKDSALASFGELGHTLEDKASPAHSDSAGNPSTWFGMPELGSPAAEFVTIMVLVHMAEEPLKPSQARSDQAIKDLHDAFKKTFGDAAYEEAVNPPSR
jgi:RHS repeat-associated protein